MNLKKPKFWDYKDPNFLAYLLLPFSYLLRLTNLLRKKNKFNKPKIITICVGNIYLGGTGKTSLSIKINELLNKKNIKSCFVKKFYPEQIDEQLLLQSRGKLFISSFRLEAINFAKDAGFETVILDDGLQDKSITYDLSFVCFNNLNWIGNGLTIPSGPLRESISSLKKYKHVFLNGNLEDIENIENIENYLFEINPDVEIYRGEYIPLNINEFSKKDKYLIFSGIGNHSTFVNMLKKYNLNIIKDIEFPDHYKYTSYDINKILELSIKMNCKIITTEKDYLRLENKKVNKINFIKSDLKIIDEDKLVSTISKLNEKY